MEPEKIYFFPAVTPGPHRGHPTLATEHGAGTTLSSHAPRLLPYCRVASGVHAEQPPQSHHSEDSRKAERAGEPLHAQRARTRKAICLCVYLVLLFSCSLVTFCSPMDRRLPGFSVTGISQASGLLSPSPGSLPNPEIELTFPASVSRWVLYHRAAWEPRCLAALSHRR